MRFMMPALLLSLCCAAASEIHLSLADGEGNVFHSSPVKAGDRFSVIFLHSVAKSPVEEVFEIVDGRRFALRETLYADFGWGLPHEELPGQRMEFADGRIRLSGYDVEFRELTLRVGHIARHRIVVGEEVVNLADHVRPGGEVKIFPLEK